MESADPTPFDPWPALSGTAFAPTRYLLHRALQAIGKLKLAEPFQAQWAHVPLWLDATGLTTGPMRHADGVCEVRADFLAHQLQWFTSSGASGRFGLGPGSVAALVDTLLAQLRGAGIDAAITSMPQEVADPIPFDEDDAPRPYERDLVDAWWRILLSVQRVMQRFQGRFAGKTQPIGLMWGTLDIRLAFYSGKPAPIGDNTGYVRRNAMNAELIEMGWWSGDSAHPEPAFYSFTYPQPEGIESAKLEPGAARWDAAMGEFILDYDEVRLASDPDRDLLGFFESTYRAGATAAGWDPALLGSGRPE